MKLDNISPEKNSMADTILNIEIFVMKFHDSYGKKNRGGI